jgi:hypothetical protein
MPLNCSACNTVSGQFVVLVERVPSGVSIGPPDEHLLERDQGVPALDRDLRQGPLLNTVWPAPQEAAFSENLEILQLRFEKKNRSKVRQQLVPRRNATGLASDLLIFYPEGCPVALLKDQLAAQQCSSGTFEDEFLSQDNILRVFTCESGSNEGTFTATFAITSESTPESLVDNGTWSFVEGSDDFVGLQGSGEWSVVYSPDGPEGVDTWTGDINYTS